MKKYRENVYKCTFWVCCQLAAWIGLFLSGDVFHKEGAEFNIIVEEPKG